MGKEMRIFDAKMHRFYCGEATIFCIEIARLSFLNPMTIGTQSDDFLEGHRAEL
jgi:hypothetical protein